MNWSKKWDIRSKVKIKNKFKLVSNIVYDMKNHYNFNSDILVDLDKIKDLVLNAIKQTADQFVKKQHIIVNDHVRINYYKDILLKEEDYHFYEYFNCKKEDFTFEVKPEKTILKPKKISNKLNLDKNNDIK